MLPVYRTSNVRSMLVLVTLASVVDADLLSACDELHQKYANGGPEREVFVSGRAHEIRVYADGRAPSRAAAALLAAGLRNRLRIGRVALHLEPALSLCELSARLGAPPDILDYPLDDTVPHLVLIPAAVWGADEDECEALQQSGGAGSVPPRLRVVGDGAAPAQLRLHVSLASRASSLPLCHRASRWSFYSNETILEICLFFRSGTPSLNMSKDVQMYYPSERHESAARMVAMAARFGFRMRPTPLELDSAPRRKLLRYLREDINSFLFLDYESYASVDRVLKVDLPPDEKEFDLMHTVRLADSWILRQAAPNILQSLLRFQPTLKNLNKILEFEASGTLEGNITEAACTVALHDRSEFESWFNLNSDNDYKVSLVVFLCQDDPDYKAYESVLAITGELINHLVKPSFNFTITSFNVACKDEHALMRGFIERIQSVHWTRLAGVAAAGGAGAGARAAAAAANALDTALVLYDTPPPLRFGHAVRVATGRADHLARALGHFLTKFRWTRLAILSEDSDLAFALVKSLEIANSFVTRDFPIGTNPESVLNNILKHKARIVFVNSNSSIAASVLCAARALDMTLEAGFVWILRDWNDAHNTCRLKSSNWSHFTISFRWRGGYVPYSFNSSSVKNMLNANYWDQLARAAPLVDALNILLRGLQHFLGNNSHRRYDIHGGNATKLFWKNLENQSIEGVTQSFEWDEYGKRNPLVYIDKWYENKRDTLAIWKLNDGEVMELYTNIFFPDSNPSDGSGFCLIKSTDLFSPKCHDVACLTALLAGALAAPALLLARRVRRRRLRRRRLAVTARLLDLRGPLAALLVDRAALALHGELGAGRFGVVRAAVLRTSGRSVVVAAKELRDESTPAEEREFLNEAVMLASLRHERVVRFVGVCVDVPPLVLMERALFRDLLGYLRARRHLCGADDEASHVDALSLTRLAREAAAALEYLSEQSVVHRDVRAANCLVDSRRSLKLADFGLARRTAADGEYSCRRRGPLPVAWMAPESIERGTYSSASDAWGLGVLVLELVTLGAAPYGEWSPLHVLRHVAAGGHPPLPREATPETRRVLEGCWRRAPGERSTAAALGAALAADPELLRPALVNASEDHPEDRHEGVALLER